MCMTKEMTRSTSKPSSRGTSPVSVSSQSSGGSVDSTSNDGNKERSCGAGKKLRVKLQPNVPTSGRTILRRSTSLHEVSFHITAGSLFSAAVAGFSLYFPFLLAPVAALKTYHFANWNYDDKSSHFDNTAWTYGTDYFLAACMMLLILSIPCHKQSSFYHAGWLSCGLLATYMISVLAGGVAHQFYTTIESQNSLSFRLIWTVCVGAVAAASGFMGPTATELLCLDHHSVDVVIHHSGSTLSKNSKPSLLMLPIIPDWFWRAYAVCVTSIVIAGGFSFQRPACDIFVVGITQFPSTFYMMLILFASLQKCEMTNRMRVAGCCGFILNAPLLPMYPILVQYTDWNLGSINTLLHSWLLVAWTLQGWTLRHVGHAVMKAEELERQRIRTNAEATLTTKLMEGEVQRSR